MLEGEIRHPLEVSQLHKQNNNKDKRPHAKAVIVCPTVVFLAVSPILLAQQATSAYAASETLQQQSQTLPQKGLAFLRPNQLGTNPSLGISLFPRQTPSKEDLVAALATLKTTLAQSQAKLNQANKNLSSATSALSTAKTKASTLAATLQSKKAALATAQTTVSDAQTALDTAKSKLSAFEAALMQQTDITAEAQSALAAAQAESTAATSNLQEAQTAYETAQANLTTATQNLTSANANLTTAQANLTSAQATYAQAQQNTQAKQQALSIAQSNYDNSQVPNPNYQPPTQTIQPTIFPIQDPNFNTGSPWMGDGTGAGQPAIHNGHLHYSYTATEVYQDISVSSPTQFGNYSLTASIWNQDTNTINYGIPTADTYGLRIYFYDGNGTLLYSDSLTSSTVHNWQDVTLQGTIPTTVPSAVRIRIAVYGVDNGFWSGTYGPAINNVRLNLGIVTGTTPAATATGTINVDIGEGGQSTFTAPNNGAFTDANLAYVSYNDYMCGAIIGPSALLGSNTITLAADNGAWGDTCGGQVKHLVGTLTYSAVQPQYIKDATLLPAITTATQELQAAQQAEATAYNNYINAQDDEATARAQQRTASQQESLSRSTLAAADAAVTASTQDVQDANNTVDEAQATADAEQQAITEATAQVNTATQDVAAKSIILSTTTTSTQSLEVEVNNLISDNTAAQSEVTSAETTFSAAQVEVSNIEADIAETTKQISTLEAEIASIPEPTPTPTPTPTPEKPKDPEPIIVVLPPLDDLTKVNFEEITPTDLTTAQAEAIKEAALSDLEVS